jgi:hypothetical protein
MVAIMSAMGLFEYSRANPLDPSSRRRNGTEQEWVTSKIVPFSGRLVIEKLECGDLGNENSKGEFVRVLVNDAVQKMGFCGSDGDGLCSLEAFVESQAYARNDGDGDWEKCFE